MRTIPLWKVLELTDDPGTGLNIGLDEYPLFSDDPAEREALNRLIINHFYLRDIGQETISIFTFFMRRTMREIMPVYNELYLSKKLLAGKELATYDLHTVRAGTTAEQAARNTNANTSRNSTESVTSEQDSTSNTSSDSTAKSRSVFFDTPQTALSRNKDYAANATDGESDTVSSGSSTGNTTGTNTATSSGTDATTGTDSTTASGSTSDTSSTTGTQGSLADMLNRYRATIINVDLMLLNDPELTSMFSLVWDDTPIEPPHRHRRLTF